MSVHSVFSTAGQEHSQGNKQGLWDCVSPPSGCKQLIIYFLQYNVVCSVSAAVNWLTAASLDKGSKGLCALQSAAHRRNVEHNNLFVKVRAMLFTTSVIWPDWSDL